MGKLKNWWQAHRPTTRRLAQLYCALLFNANLKGFVDGEIFTGATKSACVPGLNCYSCPGAVGACPLGALQNAVASSGERAGTYILGIILLFGITLGRTICGWLCPAGLIQELLHKIPTPKIRKNHVTRKLSYLKYIILAIFVVAIPLWYGLKHQLPVPAFCKYICPAGTFEGAIGLLSSPKNSGLFMMLGILFTRKFVIMLIIALLCVFCYRAFCRFLCPLGALYSLFNKFAIIGVRVDASKCTHCGKCVRSCKMDVRHVNDHECINCGACMNECAAGAISLKAGKVTLKGPDLTEKERTEQPEKAAAERRRKKRGRIFTGAALGVLAFALLWFNVITPGRKSTGAGNEATITAERASEDAAETAGTESVSEEPEPLTEGAAETTSGTESVSEETEPLTEDAAKTDTAEIASEETAIPIEDAAQTAAENTADFASSAPLGNEAGQQLPDFTAETLDGETFHLNDTRGHVTVINLWATWCGPCVQELPHFSKLQEEHPEVRVLAVHSPLVTTDVAEYLSDKDYQMKFCVDSKDETIFQITGGSTMLPQTIVLNEKGEVVYNQTGSVTYEKLEDLLRQAS